MVNLGSAVIQAVAGGAACGLTYNAPQRAVFSSTLRAVYVADTSSHAVKLANVSTGGQAVFAGTGVAGPSGDGGQAASARLNFPRAVAVDAGGNLWIADNGGAAAAATYIRKVDATTGVITTEVGRAAAASFGRFGEL